MEVGLAMVVVVGGELFTSNNLIAMAWVSRQVRTWQLLLNGFVVLLGNALGAISIAVLLVVGGAYYGADGAFGAKALDLAIAKDDRALSQHIVANLHDKTPGLLLRLDPTFAEVGGDAPLPVDGILPSLAGVTLGNIIGGSVLVAAVYWFVYLRHAPELASMPPPDPAPERDAPKAPT